MGTVANCEAVRIARSLKPVPLALREAMPEMVEALDDRSLLNLPAWGYAARSDPPYR